MKNNNPFKMVGPWIGAIIAPIAGQFVGRLSSGLPANHFEAWYLQYFRLSSYIQGGLIIIIILGFLFGWGIQKLIKK